MSDAGREGTANPAALARLRAEMAAARGRGRLDLLLDSADPEAMARALPADDLYFAIQETGLADATEVVALAAPSQFRCFIDLAAWRRDRFASGRALPWLRAARAGALRHEGAERAWRAKLAALDVELLELILRDSIRVHDLEEEPDPPAGERWLRTAEGKFAVELLVEGDDAQTVRLLLDDLYAEDPFAAARLLSAVRWELPSELEEAALRWRSGRLHDMGYPPHEEALSWFARPAPRPAAMPGAPARPPGFFLEVRPAGSLLGRAAARLPDEERAALEPELVAAANAAMVADGVDPADPEAVRRAVASARALVEVGLEVLAGGDEEAAARTLASRPVKEIFQHGFGRLLALRWRAERLLAAARGRSPGSPLEEMLGALARGRPLYYPGIELPWEEGGSPAAGGWEPRPFLSPVEVARTEEALGAAEALLGTGG